MTISPTARTPLLEVRGLSVDYGVGQDAVQAVIGADPLSGHLFLFRSRSGNRLKILTWDRDGYVLWYKRLEVGVFKLPRVAPGAGSVELRASELAMLLDGIDMAKLKRVPRYERPPKKQESVVA